MSSWTVLFTPFWPDFFDFEPEEEEDDDDDDDDDDDEEEEEEYLEHIDAIVSANLFRFDIINCKRSFSFSSPSWYKDKMLGLIYNRSFKKHANYQMTSSSPVSISVQAILISYSFSSYVMFRLQLFLITRMEFCKWMKIKEP